jgi:hypothetical protein
MNLAALYPTMSSNPLRGSVLSMYKRLLRLSQTWQVGVSILYHLRFVHTCDVDLVLVSIETLFKSPRLAIATTCNVLACVNTTLKAGLHYSDYRSKLVPFETFKKGPSLE